jgi:hypothetical protein
LEISATLITGLLVGLFVTIPVLRAVRIVPQARARNVERLGRYSKTLQPGLNFVISYIDRVYPAIDLREQVVSFQPQPVIAEDNLVVEIDTVLYFQVTDPRAAIYEIASYLQAVEQLTVTTLRKVVDSMDLERTLTSRDTINSQLRAVLDEATGKWGIRVNRVENKAIDPPAPSRKRWKSRCGPSGTSAPPSWAPKDNAGSPRCPPPKATSGPVCCAPKATGPPRSSRPKANPAPSTRSSKPSTATTPTQTARLPIPTDAAAARPRPPETPSVHSQRGDLRAARRLPRLRRSAAPVTGHPRHHGIRRGSDSSRPTTPHRPPKQPPTRPRSTACPRSLPATTAQRSRGSSLPCGKGTRATAGPPSFLLRLWWLRGGRNPLARRYDRIEGRLVLVAMLLTLIAEPFAAALGSETAASGIERARAETSTRHHGAAVTLADAPHTQTANVRGTSGHAKVDVTAKWVTADGAERLGVVPVEQGATIGTEVPICLDEGGNMTTAPCGPPTRSQPPSRSVS